MTSVTGTGSALTAGANANLTSGSTANLTALNPGGQLGENSFLQLLVTQLKYQNPLQPQSNSQFIAQLAQFTSLEQMTNVATQEAKAVSATQQLAATSQLGAAFSLLGDTVTVASSGQSVTGAVTSVANRQGSVTVTVNGQAYPFSAITSVAR